jgi:hypothetical protein
MAMHQTTVRFAPDVWAALDDEAARLGVSAAQYVREAAVARLAYGIGRRGDRAFEHALRLAGSSANDAEWRAVPGADSTVRQTPEPQPARGSRGGRHEA